MTEIVVEKNFKLNLLAILVIGIAGCAGADRDADVVLLDDDYVVEYLPSPNKSAFSLANFPGKKWSEYRIRSGKRDSFVHSPGKPIYQESKAPHGPGRMIFQDNGECAYVEFKVGEEDDSPLVAEACHVYNPGNVKDRKDAHHFSIVWSDSGQQSALLINDIPHVVFDISRGRCWSRSGFPDKRNGYLEYKGRKWDESALDVDARKKN